MPDTAQKQILDKIEERLGNISEANGYSATPTKIERARLKPLKDYDLPAINYYAINDDRTGAGAGYEERSLGIIIEYYEATRDRNFVDVAYSLAADVWSALWRDVSAPAISDDPSHALGNLVTTLLLESITPQIGEGQAPFCGAVLQVSVLYKRLPDTPFVIVN